MMEIVGITEDAKYADLREKMRPMLYVPFTQYEHHLREMQVRTLGDPAPVAATLHRVLAGVDRRLGIVGMVKLRDQVDASILAEHLAAKLSATFGLMALGLAAVGLYGLIAYVTTQRTAEIGIRMALGATGKDVLWLVVGDTLRLIFVGVLIGIPAALAGARLLGSQLYEVGPGDPVAVSLGIATLLLAAVLAGRRASIPWVRCAVIRQFREDCGSFVYFILSRGECRRDDSPGDMEADATHPLPPACERGRTGSLRLSDGWPPQIHTRNVGGYSRPAVESLSSIHEAQLRPYLKLGGWKVGLGNFSFSVLKNGIRRRALHLEEQEISASSASRR